MKNFFLFDKVTIGKINFPFFFKYFFVTFKTSLTNSVPSSPQSQGIPFLYQGDALATFLAIAEIDSMIKSNFSPSQGSHCPSFCENLYFILFAFLLHNEIASFEISEKKYLFLNFVFLATDKPT